MLLDEQYRPAPPGEETVAALVERVRATRLGVLALDPDSASSCVDGIAFAARHAGRRLAGGRRQDPAERRWTSGWCRSSQRATSRADLAAVDLTMVLTAMLSWDQQTQLAELVPATLTTAAGRTVAIDYERDNPTVSVRVQDMFGTRTHPTIANGVPLTIELLSPADRPIQITSDLPGFWSGSWAMVRKDLPAVPETSMAGRPVDRPTETPEGPARGLTALDRYHDEAHRCLPCRSLAEENDMATKKAAKKAPAKKRSSGKKASAKKARRRTSTRSSATSCRRRAPRTTGS